jgi:hypothetical protein
LAGGFANSKPKTEKKYLYKATLNYKGLIGKLSLRVPKVETGKNKLQKLVFQLTKLNIL